MVEKSAGGSAPSAAPAASAAAAPLVDEVGVYLKDKDGKWVELYPEVINWKPGGVLKRFASNGIVKGDINGHG
jgi:hypothetical protein